MKRRAIIVLLAAVMTVGVFAGCKGSNESDSAKTEETADGGESKDDILGDGVFTVGRISAFWLYGRYRRVCGV